MSLLHLFNKPRVVLLFPIVRGAVGGTTARTHQWGCTYVVTRRVTRRVVRDRKAGSAAIDVVVMQYKTSIFQSQASGVD